MAIKRRFTLLAFTATIAYFYSSYTSDKRDCNG